MKKLFFLVVFSVCFIGLNAQVIQKVWSTERVLKTPESVWYNEQTNQIYVSNINGKPQSKDGNGFISLMDTTGEIVAMKWVVGMDAPKGMAVWHDSLFVTDIDKVHIISIRDAKIVTTVKVVGAVFLNDIVVTSDGTAYISDMQSNKLFMLKDGRAEVWLEDELLVNPNGMLLLKNDLIAVGAKNSILRVNLNTKNIKTIVDDTGPVDGLVLYGNNKYIISNWEGRILIASPGEKIVLYNKSGKDQTADLGYIPEKRIVLIPAFNGNRVVAVQILKKVTDE